MSSIFIVAPLLGVLASCVILLVIRNLPQWCGTNGGSKNIGCAIPLLVFITATTFFSVWLPRFTTYSGRGASAETANEFLLTFDVPAAARSVDYRTAYFSGLIDAADFDIAESDFLEWMRETNRKPVAFSRIVSGIEWADGKERFGIDLSYVVPVSAILGNSKDEREIEAGFYFDDYEEGVDGDSGLTIVYDSDRHRAYIQRTTF